MKKIGAITVGQSPRVDLTPEMEPILGDSVELIQMGALDGLSREEIEAFVPGKDDHVLVSRLCDGTSVTFGESHILPRLQNCIDTLEAQGVSLILFLCTGEFPDTLTSHVPLVFPSRIVTSMVPAVAPGCRLAVLTPSAAQIDQNVRKWAPLVGSVTVLAASPYAGTEAVLKTAGNIPKDADLIVLDCIGYTVEMKEKIQALTKKPVILSRTLVARMVREMV